MQIVGERGVRVVPDVAVAGNGAGAGMAEGLLGVLLRQKSAEAASAPSSPSGL